MYLTNIVFWLIQMNDLIETTPELAVTLFPVLNYSKNVLNLPYLNYLFLFFLQLLCIILLDMFSYNLVSHSIKVDFFKIQINCCHNKQTS